MTDPRARVAPLVSSLLNELGLPQEVLEVVSGLVGGRVIHLVDDVLGVVFTELVKQFDPNRFTEEQLAEIYKRRAERVEAGNR